MRTSLAALSQQCPTLPPLLEKLPELRPFFETLAGLDGITPVLERVLIPARITRILETVAAQGGRP